MAAVNATIGAHVDLITLPVCTTRSGNRSGLDINVIAPDVGLAIRPANGSCFSAASVALTFLISTMTERSGLPRRHYASHLDTCKRARCTRIR
jgi:hypothetical protein